MAPTVPWLRRGEKVDEDQAPMAAVIGDMDTLLPLGRAGIPCAVVAGRDSAVRFSRFARVVIDAGDSLLEALQRFARTQDKPPVLFYERDWTLQLISENRDRLLESCRFVAPDAALVEQLVDKEKFQSLADRAGLPVPRSVALHRGQASTSDIRGLRFPVVVKPVPYRDDRWREFASHVLQPPLSAGFRASDAKSIRVESRSALEPLLRRALGASLDLLVQELVPGPEHRIETYHAYVDEEGRLAGEFTGRTLRTNPPELGLSTALTTTAAPDVAELGREVLERLGFRGVAMVEMKRAPDGRLHLLEINPRFTRWLRLGAAAGLNLSAMIYADLTGRPRPPTGPARAGVTWCRPREDAAAAAAVGMSRSAWLRWLVTCDLNSVFFPDDPLPYLVPKALRLLRGDRARTARLHAAKADLGGS